MKLSSMLTLVLALTLSAFALSANYLDKITFTGTDYFDPLPILSPNAVGAFLNPGSVECPGHQPTGNPMNPCPPGSRIHIRGTQVTTRMTATDPRLTGTMHVDSNSNFSPDFTGPQWGSFRLVYDLGGEMRGTWQGVRYKDGNTWIVPIHATGRVFGGPFDGATAVINERAVGYTPMPVAWIGEVTGTFENVR